ncbi:TlpA family protein disulfide reductase [Chitinophaga sp. RAB17]|uniref:TlpA family protein disulfide reductase n=1 Tax=Chitinophaga sp. RAB17 TaxID=3233049 RepID=UPI003F8FA21B
MKSKKDIITIGIVILLGIFLFISASKFIEARSPSKNVVVNYRKPILSELEGQTLPSFKLLLPDSSTLVDVSKTLPNKPIVLFYFGPDCPYCQAEISEIIKEMDNLKNIQFYLFTAYPFDQMRRFYETFQLSRYPNIITGYDYKFFFFEHFKIESVPGIAIYGKDRRLKGTFIGNISYKQILDLSEK